MGRFTVELDKNACQGFGGCVELCAHFFQLSDVDGKSNVEAAKKVVKENEVPTETLELDKSIDGWSSFAREKPLVVVRLEEIAQEIGLRSP